MPNLEAPTLSSPASLPIVPVKPVPNRAVNFFTLNTLNLDSASRMNRSKDELVADSGGDETASGGGDEAGEGGAKSLDEMGADSGGGETARNGGDGGNEAGEGEAKSLDEMGADSGGAETARNGGDEAGEGGAKSVDEMGADSGGVETSRNGGDGGDEAGEGGAKSLDEMGADSGGSEPARNGGDGGGDEAGEDGVKSLDEHIRDWVRRKVDAGVSEKKCYFPFLSHAPKMDDCRVCKKPVYPGEETKCSVRDCPEVYHLTCVVESVGLSASKPFRCPQHACFLCKDKFNLLRCTRCAMASHTKCAPFSDSIIKHCSNPGKVLCWRHPDDWRLDLKQPNPSKSIEEVFSRLPLPYIEEDFKIDITWKNTVENKSTPPPYVPIKRNIYLIKKKKRVDDSVDVGCTSCWATDCAEDCVCRLQCISCTKACKCSKKCFNRPFRAQKKISIVQTELCGWGAVTAEPIKKGDFIIEYVGEVIDDALCEQRLWKMKHKKEQNFYLCELSKDFTIDATEKGNSSRFLNHSCDPNCKLEKWEVEGETRVGVFAARYIEAGEPLTYDYRFVQFGPQVACHCGASNCQGYLGMKRKINKVDLCQNWGSRRKRTSTGSLGNVKED